MAKAAAKAAKPAADDVPAAAEAAATAPDASVAEAVPTLKLKDLLDRVAARSGAKKKDARPVIEATLAVLGEALSRGEALNLPEFGKAKVNRQKGDGATATMVVKLRRGAPKLKVTEAAAE